MKRLKDQELQRKLDEISDGAFTPAFNGCGGEYDECKEDCSVWFGPRTNSCRYKYVATFTKDEVEEVTQYDPENWNEWPGVTPTTNELMQIEVHAPLTIDGSEVIGGGCIFRGCGKFVAGVWVHGNGLPVPLTKDLRIHFRPWNLGVPK